ncbi:MAG: ArnT family glycosyltransferase [Planctomycetota bacterium]|jgi:hypothetical protein
MSRKKKKKKNAGKTDQQAPAADTPKPLEEPRYWSLKNTGMVLDILLVVAVLIIAVQLFRYASGAYFFTDECFHGVLARHATNFSFPAFIPEIFTERWNFIPPLLHAVAGLGAMIFRTEYVFRFVNVVLLLGTIIGAHFLLRKYANARAARIAALICLTCPLVYQFALRFYQEEITFACMMFSSVLLYSAAREPSKWKLAAVTGILFGLTVEAKQSGLALFGVAGVLGVLALPWLRLGRKGDFKRAFILGIAMLIAAAPFLVRSLVAFGNPVYPFLSKPLVPVWYALQSLAFPITKKQLFISVGSMTGPVFLLSVVFAAGMLFFSVRQKQLNRGSAALWILLLVCMAAFLAGPGGQPRHWIALIPVMAILASVGLSEAFSENPKVLDIVAGVLVVYVILIGLDLPDYRSNASHGSEGENRMPVLWFRFPRIEPRDGFNSNAGVWKPVINSLKNNATKDDLLLSPWAYTPAYHANLRVTWPDAISPKSPINLFEAKLRPGVSLGEVKSEMDFVMPQYTPGRKEKVLEAMREHGISFVALFIPFCRYTNETPHYLRYPHFMWYSLFQLRMEGKITPVYNDFRSKKAGGKLEPAYFKDQYGRIRPAPQLNNPFIILDIRPPAVRTGSREHSPHRK